MDYRIFFIIESFAVSLKNNAGAFKKKLTKFPMESFKVDWDS